MAISLQALLERSIDRMGEGMNQVVQESALEVIRRSYAEGIYVQLSAGYRSFAEQNALYVKGRRGIKDESVITNAKGGQSYHNYGLAVDYFLVTDDGQTALWTVNSKWRRVAAIAKELGFEWGGDWTSFKDNPHLQMSGGLSISQLQSGKRPNLILKASSINTKDAIKVVERDINKVSDWASKDWHEATLNGYFDGIRPGDTLTREEAAIVINRLRNNMLDLINK